MIRSFVAFFLLTTAASEALAQEEPKHALTLTDVLEFGQFSLTGRLALFDGKATLADPTGAADLDFDLTTFDFSFEGAVGLGQGFEVEVAIPYQFVGDTDGDGDLGGVPVDFESENEGFGDLEVTPVYRLMLEDESTPQWIVAAIIVAPTGNDKRGRPEISAGPLSQSGEKGGIGEGVWNYGLGTAVSKRFGIAEPYVGFSYVIGGKRSRNGVDEDRADVGSILLGSEWHVSPDATLDTRVFIQFSGEDVTEDGGVKTKEEANVSYGFQTEVYIHLGSGFSLLAGGAVLAVEDHEVDDTGPLDIEDTVLYGVQIGIHYFFGGE